MSNEERYQQIWRSLSDDGGAESWSDTGNADRFREHLHRKVKGLHCIEGQWWFLFESYPSSLPASWWKDKGHKYVHYEALDLIHEMMSSARTDLEKRFAARSGDLPRVKAMIELAEWMGMELLPAVTPNEEETEEDFVAREKAAAADAKTAAEQKERERQ
jgi:hypothetical protein